MGTISRESTSNRRANTEPGGLMLLSHTLLLLLGCHNPVEFLLESLGLDRAQFSLLRVRQRLGAAAASSPARAGLLQTSIRVLSAGISELIGPILSVVPAGS